MVTRISSRSEFEESPSKHRAALKEQDGRKGIVKRSEQRRRQSRRSHEARPNALSSLAGERERACVQETNAPPVAQCRRRGPR